jgi:phytoene dehydrogenase-like protein
MDATCADLGPDGRAWRSLLEPFLRNPHGLLSDALGPLGVPRHPFLLARFGRIGLGSATGLARRFRGTRARALFAGCAAHAILPLDRLLTGSVGMIFALTGHVREWPVVAGAPDRAGSPRARRRRPPDGRRASRR